MRFSHSTAPALLVLALVACSDYELEGEEDTPTPPEPVGDDDDTTPVDDDDSTPPEFCDELGIGGGECSIDEDCVVEDVGTFTPVIRWSRPTWAFQSNYDDSMMAPMVANLTDDNGDGNIDADDDPDIALVTYQSGGYIRVVSGHDGAEIWTSLEPVDGQTGLAIGDIDVDGFPEIVATTGDLGIIAFEHDATFKWRTPPLGEHMPMDSNNPALSDMDHDGDVEVIVGSAIVAGADGAILGRGLGCQGFNPWGSVGASSFAADYDRDGIEEVLAGCSIYNLDGTLELSLGVDDGFPGVANFDGDPQGEIVLVGQQAVRLYDDDGALLWSTPLLGMDGGPPTIADLDGDGEVEVGVASRTNYAVYDTDGTLLWTRTTTDASSGVTGSSVFDFEGDGICEVVYADELDLWVFAGPDGSVKLRESQHTSNTWLEYPVIADVDSDGHAEIVFTHNTGNGPGGTGLSVVEDLDDSWRPTRPIWNQHAYSITNVEDDGTIPTHAAVNWDTYNNFRSGDISVGPTIAHDVEVEILDVCELECDGARVLVHVQVCNHGTVAIEEPFHLSLYANDAGTLILLETVEIETLASGTLTQAIPVEIEPALIAGRTLVVVVDDDGSGEGVLLECDEDNNIAMWGDVICAGARNGYSSIR